MNTDPVVFRFSAADHHYSLEDGTRVPSITQLLKDAGLVDDSFFSAESATRGTWIHRHCSDYDLGALDQFTLVKSDYRGWVLGHIKAIELLNPRWTGIEEPSVHPTLGFGGRPDREGYIYDAVSVLELKSGGKDKAHAIQLALQAVLVAPKFGLPAKSIQRYVEYLTKRGKVEIEQCLNPRDFDEAYRILKRFI